MTSVLKNQVFTPEQRQKRNYLIHQLYVRKDWDECLTLIEDTLEKVNQLAEYPLYVKGLILRHRGNIQDSLHFFQLAAGINPNNISNLKQVGRSLFLLGRHKASMDVLEQAVRVGGDEDWELWHNKGLCLAYLRRGEEAKEAFQRANSIQRHDCTFMQLGQLLTQEEKYEEAVDTYLEALEFSPENPEMLTTIGLLYLRMGENYKAFDFLGNSLTHDPKNPKTILAAGSIIQDHSDMDVALVKYRVAAVKTPSSAQLWNNVGMCFFGKQRYVASIACLKKALYLDPFEWIISYNLGLVHLNTGQYASAFHHFSASINLKPDFPSSYMHLAITLSRLNDVANATAAYEKAIEMETDFLFHLNFAVMLVNNGDDDRAKEQFAAFEALYSELDEETKTADKDVVEMRLTLKERLGK
mmetsp:Transcript_2192/g.5096  ORF Transcript_2192/g.5096 Transcript_2192/m.5096 type:complete len:413 (-) Transcript_2192:142-1380(-)|eukprot:CAMPEP_0177709668 /NCGR_PEP_ID=MMETSP0484_2-20121128/10926_1 /TAXON_ID=354590 /ORGANISM="Rhodomonas lens, Strain RHODO" /LENGTH=412 /DNA_ID=CAMNT_0019221301 /DNA_START=206 /DNA_END=1444 /DNA_ORIENTATION=+